MSDHRCYICGKRLHEPCFIEGCLIPASTHLTIDSKFDSETVPACDGHAKQLIAEQTATSAAVRKETIPK
jgi:hypothetical protein